ncbi:sister chromatid cohesion C-terminus-domain-containing protein, partial [Papiliotrema laurentii]
LIQASSFGITKRIRRLRTATLNSLVGDLSGSTTPSERSDSIDEESRICSDRIESSLKSAKIVALVSRSAIVDQGKVQNLATIQITKVVLDIFNGRLPHCNLTVLSRILIAALEDRGTDNAVKGLALDYLGDIAAKLRWFHVEASKTPATLSLDEIISNADTVACADLCSFDMSTLVWAQELHLAIKKSGSIVDKLAEEKDTEAQDTRVKLQEIAQLLKNTLRNAWTGDDNLFEVSDPNASNAANAACIAVSRGRPLQNAFGPILNALVSTMGVSLINLRSKALRGLGTIVTVDPDVLSHASVKQAIDERLSDSSAAVRDAAVELVGKYVVQKPSLAVEYYPHLALRVSDSGLAVRKRVIKLLKGIFGTTTEKDIKVDICCKMITLTGDTDENIQELAIKTVYEMIYPPVSWDKAATATLLVEVIAEYQGGAVVLEGGISQIVKECEKGGHEDRLVDTIDALIELLTDGTERHDFDPLSHIRAIFMLVLARADLIDVNKAEILLSYLRRKPANIFKTCIPSMPRVASSFATKLSEDLVPMISAPSGGFPSLKETVACFCAVANHLTRDYSAVMRILLSCESRTRAMRNEWNTTGKATQASSPAGPIFVFVCASLAEHCNFDALSETDATVKNGLQRISPDRPLYEHLFDACLDFTKMPIPQMAPSLCLGSLFRAYPVLILREEATDWMDGVFASNDTTTQARLLGVIHDFLLSEADKKAGSRDGKQKKKNEGKDVDALIGNAAELSESGLSTAVVQRNIQHILNGAKSQHLPTQSAALDILAFTVTQGLYHPLQCLPILISLETSENETVAERALDLHRMLHSKHSTLVNVRFLEFAKASYEYQRTLTAEVAGHRDGLALLSGWYSLIGEKRAWRHDFLKQLCRVFDYDLTGTAVPDVGLVLYICDNLATLEYKLQEEAMTVVSLLSGVVAQATGLVMVLENGTVEGSGSESVSGKRIPTAEAGETYSADVVIHSSILVTLALLIKNHLLDMYGLPEDKCIKHVPGKKTTVGDKPAVKRREGGLDLSRVSLVRGVTTVDDFKAQRTTFLELVHEDGSKARESDGQSGAMTPQGGDQAL